MKKRIEWRSAARILPLMIALIVGMSLNGYAAALKQTDVYYVNDYANVLDQDVEDRIIAANVSLEEQTGAQVVVVTVDFTGGKDIVDYATDLFNDWGIGSADKNNGVLLLLAIGDDDYYALPGTGLEQGLSAGTLDNLLARYLEPDFAVQSYSAGTQKIFNEIIAQLESYYGISVAATSSGTASSGAPQPVQQQGGSNAGSATQKRNIGGSFFEGLFMLIIVLVLIAVILGGTRRVFRPVYRPRPFFFPRVPRRHHHHHHQPHSHHPPHGGGRPPSFGGQGPGPGKPSQGGGMFSGMGGSSRGGGAGRNSSGGIGGMRGGGSFGGGRPSGGMRTGGGGASRGSGAGRRK